jgi:UDP-N-acetylglucosamine 2-epimerase (non-hydrolysing)
MANAVNPYGDGRAAQRAVAALAHHFSLGPPAEEFDSAPVSPAVPRPGPGRRTEVPAMTR